MGLKPIISLKKHGPGQDPRNTYYQVTWVCREDTPSTITLVVSVKYPVLGLRFFPIQGIDSRMTIIHRLEFCGTQIGNPRRRKVPQYLYSTETSPYMYYEILSDILQGHQSRPESTKTFRSNQTYNIFWTVCLTRDS